MRPTRVSIPQPAVALRGSALTLGARRAQQRPRADSAPALEPWPATGMEPNRPDGAGLEGEEGREEGITLLGRFVAVERPNHERNGSRVHARLVESQGGRRACPIRKGQSWKKSKKVND